MERTLEDENTITQCEAAREWNASPITFGLSFYLVAVLSLTQGPVVQWSSAVMADRNEAPREGDVSVLALCQEVLALQLLLHRSMSPELMLRGQPVQRLVVCALFRFKMIHPFQCLNQTKYRVTVITSVLHMYFHLTEIKQQ